MKLVGHQTDLVCYGLGGTGGCESAKTYVVTVLDIARCLGSSDFFESHFCIFIYLFDFFGIKLRKINQYLI